MLVYAAHGLTQAEQVDIERIKLAAFIQMGAAAAALAISNRSGRINLIAGALIVGGAAIFSVTLYTFALGVRGITFLAPIGGITLLLGWAALLFAKPRG